jgi:hypothetical protein
MEVFINKKPLIEYIKPASSPTYFVLLMSYLDHKYL